MNPLQGQSPIQLQSAGIGQGNLNSRTDDGIPVTATEYASSDHSFLALSTLPCVDKIPSNQDSEKESMARGPVEQYAKDVGEAPDGGLKAWSVILASSLTCCATLGYANAWGVFQAYYEEEMLHNESPSNISWIGSTQYALIFLPGLISGRLFDMGYLKIPYFLASCLLIICTFLVAECKVYWQFLLAQGLGTGLANGILFGPATAVVSHWFSKRRGLALGIYAIGSSVGGTVFPIAAQNLIPNIGFKWTMRIFGFMLILILGIANLTLDRRLPPVIVKGGLINWAALKNPAYSVYCISATTAYLGLYTVLTYLPTSAMQVGIPTYSSFHYIAIVNGSSAFGRISAGYLADRLGAVSVMMPFTLVVAVMTFVWPFAKMEGALVAISVIYGFSCGTYVALFVAPAMAIGTINDAGRQTGFFLSLVALGAVAEPPISGAINSVTGGFEGVGWYAGSILIFSVCLMLLARYLHLGKLMGKF